MSKIAKASANKKHNVPDFKIVGKTTPDIVKKINQLVVEKKANDVISIIDYINNILSTTITNVSVDTWSDGFTTEWKRNADYSTPICGVFLVSKGSVVIEVDKREYNIEQGELCFVNEWSNHRLINRSVGELTMLLAQFVWNKEENE